MLYIVKPVCHEVQGVAVSELHASQQPVMSCHGVQMYGMQIMPPFEASKFNLNFRTKTCRHHFEVMNVAPLGGRHHARTQVVKRKGRYPLDTG